LRADLYQAAQVAGDLVQCGSMGAQKPSPNVGKFLPVTMHATACYTIKLLSVRRFFAPVDKRVPLYNPIMNSRILNAAEAVLARQIVKVTL
jgi:hypothetical protein